MPVNKNRYGKWFYDLPARLSPTRKRTRVVIPTARTKQQALEAERAAIQRIHEGKYGTPMGSMLLKDYVKKYYEAWTKLNKRSWRNDVYRLKPIVAFFGKHSLRDISPFLIEVYKLARLKTPIMSKYKQKDRAPASVNRELALLSSIFRQAMRDKKAAENPCRDVESLQGEKHRQRYLLPDEETRLLPVLIGDRAHLLPMVILAINTGLREMELFTLKSEQIDFNRGAILVTETKSGTDRWVPMNSTAESLLRDLCDDARRRGYRYVFTNKRTKSHYTTIKTAWKFACDLVGISGLNFHDLRHTFGTRAADGGAALGDLQKVMGHAQITTTMQYVHATEPGKRRAVNAVQGPLAKVLKMRKRG
jgi:integrase